MSKCYIGRSSINRKGLFLNKDVKKDEIVFRFTGESIKQLKPWYHGPNWLQVGYLEWIIPKPGHQGNYLNHSCNPNAGVRGTQTIVAIRPIMKGEEVTIDYALSETFPLWHMKCNCKNKNCRKVVKPYQDLSIQRQKKYLEYTSQYIKDLKMHLSWEEYIKTKEQ